MLDTGQIITGLAEKLKGLNNFNCTGSTRGCIIAANILAFFTTPDINNFFSQAGRRKEPTVMHFSVYDMIDIYGELFIRASLTT